MSANFSENGANPDHQADQLIYIVGPQTLRNEVMASFLGREIGAKCRTDQYFPPVSSQDDKSHSPPKLVLWDCLGKDGDALLSELQSDADAILAGELMALFNLTAGEGIEEQAIPLGVRGFFYEQDTPEQFLRGIRAVLAGALWLPKGIVTRSFQENNPNPHVLRRNATVLTRREAEILGLVAMGARNEEIADQLCISPNTVKAHVYNIYRKINVPNRLQAALWAAKHLS